MGKILSLSLSLVIALVVTASFSAYAGEWNKEEWLKKLEAAKSAEGTTLIQYDAQPNYANWGGITAYFRNTYGVEIPPDMKSSVTTLVALLKEQANTVADLASGARSRRLKPYTWANSRTAEFISCPSVSSNVWRSRAP